MGVPALNPEKIAEIFTKSQSVRDKYRQNLSLDDRQKLLVVVMTKYTILAVAAVLTTQLFVITGVLSTFLVYNSSENDDQELNVVNIVNGIYYYIWSLDCLIGSLCCYLNFKMNDRLYYKLC